MGLSHISLLTKSISGHLKSPVCLTDWCSFLPDLDPVGDEQYHFTASGTSSTKVENVAKKKKVLKPDIALRGHVI